eukprot:scaffold157129_cov38-Prasinocladus_malaysianus.AAC.1
MEWSQGLWQDGCLYSTDIYTLVYIFHGCCHSRMQMLAQAVSTKLVLFLRPMLVNYPWSFYI